MNERKTTGAKEQEAASSPCRHDSTQSSSELTDAISDAYVRLLYDMRLVATSLAAAIKELETIRALDSGRLFYEQVFQYIKSWVWGVMVSFASLEIGPSLAREVAETLVEGCDNALRVFDRSRHGEITETDSKWRH